MRANRDAAIRHTLQHEGGYVDHPRDPGGATNLGITIGTLSRHLGRRASKAEVQALTVATAIAIYARDYWDPIRADDMPGGVDAVTFDASVNSGIGRGPKWTQAAAGLKGRQVDGKVGPVTLAALRAADPVHVIRTACALRMGFLRGLKTWGTFGRGWSRRVAGLEVFAVSLAVGGPALVREAARGRSEAEARARRETAGAGGTAAAGGGSVAWSDVPAWAAAVAGILLVLIVINFLGRRRHERARAEAYAQLAQEAKP